MLLFIIWFLLINTNFAFSKNRELLSPKILQPIDNTINLVTPTFKWISIEGANGYTIYINQNENRVFESSIYGAITRTEYTIPENILKNNNSYTIQLRAFNTLSWSEYSNPFHFTIQEAEKEIQLAIPNVITKTKTHIDTINGQKVNNLLWNSVKEASNYELIIDGISSSSIFGNEITNLVKTTEIDSSFLLNSKLFIDYDKFRWKLRSQNYNQKSRFTPFYYFKLNNRNEILQENQPDEIAMRLKYAGFIDEMIIAQYYDGKILLPVLEILSILKLNHTYDFKNEIIYGERSDGTNLEYQLDFLNNELLIGDLKTKEDKTSILKTELEYFVSEEIVENVTGMNLDVDMSNLSIVLSSDFILPMIQRKINAQKLSLYKDQISEEKYPLVFNRQRKYLSGGFLDYSGSANFIKNQSAHYSLNLGLGAEMLGGDIQVNSQQSLVNNKLNYSDTRYKWRYAFLNNDYISNVSLGHNNLYGLQSYDFNGIQISNEPVEARRTYGHYKIEEKTEPNWKVEVYRNGQLIEILDADSKGNYDIHIPFSYGTTMLELHEIGTNGEYNIKNRMYQIPTEQIPRGRLDYSMNFGELINSGDYLFQSKAAYGISNWLTTKIGADIFPNEFETSSIYSKTTARLFDGYIANMIIAPNAYSELSINSIFTDLASFNIGVKSYEENHKLNPTNINTEYDGNIFIPVKFNRNMMSVLLRGRHTSFANSQRSDISLRTFYNFSGFSPSLELNYYNLDTQIRNLEAVLLNLRVNYSLNIPSPIFSGNIVDARFIYDLMNKKSQSMNISFSSTILQQFRVQLSHTTNFQNSYSNTQLRIIFDLPFFRSNTTMAKNIISQSFVGSINYNEHLEDVNFYNRGMLGRSAASFKFYVDKNTNNKYDSGEILVPDMDVQINSIGTKRRIDNGNIIVNDLESYSKYEVELVDKHNKNPLWFPYKEKFSFVSDPHQYKEIQIPFYEAAELLGTVNKRSNNNLVPISGLNILLEHKGTRDTVKIKTMSDGSFYHYGLKPGDYNIFLDEGQLTRLNLKPTPSKYTSSIRSINVEDKFTKFNFILE